MKPLPTISTRKRLPLAVAVVLTGFLLVGLASPAKAQGAAGALSDVDRETREGPTCNQMKSYAAQIDAIQKESQAITRRPNRRRLCDMLGRATSLLAETISFMRTNLGQCNITEAGITQMGAATRDLAATRAKNCR